MDAQWVFLPSLWAFSGLTLLGTIFLPPFLRTAVLSTEFPSLSTNKHQRLQTSTQGFIATNLPAFLPLPVPSCFCKIMSLVCRLSFLRSWISQLWVTPCAAQLTKPHFQQFRSYTLPLLPNTALFASPLQQSTFILYPLSTMSSWELLLTRQPQLLFALLHSKSTAHIHVLYLLRPPWSVPTSHSHSLVSSHKTLSGLLHRLLLINLKFDSQLPMELLWTTYNLLWAESHRSVGDKQKLEPIKIAI